MRKTVALVSFLALAGCGDSKPTITVSSDNVCDQSTDTMVRMAQACAQGGGKYPEDCIKTAVEHFCPEVATYRWADDRSGNHGAWTPCSKAISLDSRSACAAYTK